jgi:hypothetical protein
MYKGAPSRQGSRAHLAGHFSNLDFFWLIQTSPEDHNTYTGGGIGARGDAP